MENKTANRISQLTEVDHKLQLNINFVIRNPAKNEI